MSGWTSYFFNIFGRKKEPDPVPSSNTNPNSNAISRTSAQQISQSSVAKVNSTRGIEVLAGPKYSPQQRDERAQLLEHQRRRSALIFQKNYRRYRDRKNYLKKKKTVIHIQALYRGKSSRKKFRKILYRRNIMKEILSTEIKYVDNLTVIVEIFLHPLLEVSILIYCRY